MATERHALHVWQLVEATLDETSGGDVVEVALSRSQATLWYGDHCFELTSTVEDGGERVLRLEEVGRRADGAGKGTVVIFLEDGYCAEERVAPCRGSLDDAALREVDAKVLHALARALLDDTARLMDSEGEYV